MESWQREWDAPQPKEWGVSPPRSFDLPAHADLDRTNALKKFLEKAGISKSKNDAKLEVVLAELRKIVKSWVKIITTEKGLQLKEEPNALLFSFGSYRLGVHIPEDDLDILCIGPSYVSREKDFFTTLHATLGRMKEVTDLECFPGAHIPAMKFKFQDISVELIYASVPLLVVPEGLNISDDKLLPGPSKFELLPHPSKKELISDEDETNLRCLNTCRVAKDIVELVPNLEVFQTTLRFLKHWAKTRGIYCNDTGCLGGTPWALLVARICQAYPYAESSTVVSKFFEVYDEWFWPTPVMLCLICGDHHIGFVWNPSAPADKAHLMPIISPSYPCRNLSTDVSEFMLREVREQFRICNKICKKLKRDYWAELCQPFLEAYQLYLCMKISAKDAQDLESWNGWIKPFWRQLPSKIELPYGTTRCHPNPHGYVRPSGGASVYHFIGISRIQVLEGGGGLQLSTPRVAESVIEEFERNIKTYGLINSEMKCEVFHTKKADIAKLGCK